MDRLVTDPNPCIGSGLCTTRVTLYSSSTAQVWVNSDGRLGSLFMCGSGTITQAAPWIRGDSVAEFVAYPATSCEPSGRIDAPFARVTAVAVPALPTMPPANIGANKFDLWLQYLGQASGGNGSAAYRTVETAMARKAMADIRDAGSTFVRVSIPGWSVESITPWRTDPGAYFARMDEMFADLRANNLKIVPVFVWFYPAFPAAASDTNTNFIKNPNAPSRALLKQYVRDFVTRYKNDPAIAFYELTNELNLAADLDMDTRCASSCPWSTGNITTNDMIGFSSSIASYIRVLDPAHAISSGYSMPRPSAERLRANPEWVSGVADWTADSRDDFARHITETNQGLDIVSIHSYSPDFARFGSVPETLSTVMRYVTQAGKKLYIGEYGETNALDAFREITATVPRLGIQYASPWIWEFYHSNLYEHYNDQNATELKIEPGYADDLITYIRTANAQLGITDTVDVSRPPRVVLTWPIDGMVVSDSQLVHAVASTGQGRAIARVVFLLDGASLASVSSAPYQFHLQRSRIATGTHVLVARAYDASGRSSDSSIVIRDGVVDNSASVDAPCAWNGQDVMSGSSVTAYQSSAVTSGQQCVSEQRTCTDGALSGTYQYASCAAGPSVACTPSWSCSAWSACSSGSQGRTCADTNACGVVSAKPSEMQACTIVRPAPAPDPAPVPTPVTTLDTTTQKIAVLLSQIAQLQSLLAQLRGETLPETSPSCPVLSRSLHRGMRGEDVVSFQRFLVSQGTLEAGNDTGYFGPLTEQAVQKWQAQYGVVSSGDPDSTGYGLVGPKTRAAIVSACVR